MDKLVEEMKKETRAHSLYDAHTLEYGIEQKVLLQGKRSKSYLCTKTNNPVIDTSSETTKILQKQNSEEFLKGKKDMSPKLVSRIRSEKLETIKIIITSIEEVKDMSPDVDIESQSEQIYNNHMKSTFMALRTIRRLTPPSLSTIQPKQITLVRPPGCENRKTIIFDLDETLVHCVGSNKGEISLPIEFPSGKVVMAGVNIRPFAVECLHEASRLFEVVVFTASHQCYADVILDYLDPMHTLIHHRLYRENCVRVGDFNVKDLRIFGNRKIQNISIVDNSIFSFAFHLDNGVPIISWYNDRNDKELSDLVEYFKVIDEAEDVREINRQIFHLDSFYDDFKEEFTGR